MDPGLLALPQQLHACVAVVLMQTSHPGNIGAVARAMMNMGLSRLVLVQPKIFPSEEAVARAAGADALLARAHVCQSLAEAVADAHLVIAVSAGSRALPWPTLSPRALAQSVVERIALQPGLRVALVFGRESTGLSNDELQCCNYHVSIPSVPEFSSLNLAMAVQVICYELRMALLQRENDEVLQSVVPQASGWDHALASHAEVEGVLAHLERVLVEVNFLDPERPRSLMPRMRRLFQRSHLDKMDVNILRGFLNAVQKKLPK